MTDTKRGNQGWSTKPKDGSHAGRPFSERGKRSNHGIRAFDDEWNVLKDFLPLLRKDIEASKEAIRWLADRIRQKKGI